MICKSCFGIVQKDAQFCPHCGTKTGGEAAQQNTPPPQDLQKQDEYQPYIPPPPEQQVTAQPASGLATASMVMGILSLTFLGPLGGILGLIFALVARSQGNRSGQATAGLVMSIISLSITVLFVGCFVCFVAMDIF